MKDLRTVPLLMREGVEWKERREELLELLANEMYGQLPDGRTMYIWRSEACEGGEIQAPCSCRRFWVTASGRGGSYAFPFRLWLPRNGREKHPAIVYLGVNGDACEVEHGLNEPGMPPEWLLEEGYAVAVCMAVQIEKDNAETFPQGLAKVLCPERSEHSAGALAVWAEGMRVAIDILTGLNEIDPEHIAVAGCSRCGKAALWCGAQDERVYLTASFNSGCGGAAISSGKQGESLAGMNQMFPHWMCRNMKKYESGEEELPFEQNMLLGLIAPRRLLVTSSTEDLWSDPYAEFLGLVYAGEAYEQYGKKGINTWIWPPKGKLLAGDGAAYYLREGKHGVEEEDWRALAAYMKMERE